MSTKNFVSYGDAESLMSGIKDAIDNAGGGGVNVNRVSVAKITISNTDTFAIALQQLYSALHGLSLDVVYKTKILLHTFGGSIVGADYPTNCILDYSYSVKMSATNIVYFFGCSHHISKNTSCNIDENSANIYHVGTVISSAKPTDYYIDYIELFYYEVEEAVVPSGDDTLIHSFTDTSQSVTTAFTSFDNYLNNMTPNERKKCYLYITATGNINYKVVGTEFVLPFLSKNTDGANIFGTYGSNYSVYIQPTAINVRLGATVAVVSNNSLSTVSITGIYLYKS